MADKVLNYLDSTGRPRTTSAGAPGVVGYESEAINPATGMTASGDKANPFRGYRSAQGGGFGGYGSVVNPKTGVTAQDYDAKVGQAIRGFKPDWSQVDRKALTQQFTPDTIGSELSALDGLRERAFRGESLSPTDQARLAIADDPTVNPFRSANDAMRLGVNYETGKAIDPSLTDYHDRAVAAGAMTPEQAARWKAFPAEFAAKQQAESRRAAANVDPFGRFEAPTAAANVIKPGQNRMQMQDPFAPFTPGISPQVAPNPNPMMGAPANPGVVAAPTFANMREGGPAPATDLGGSRPAPTDVPLTPPDPFKGPDRPHIPSTFGAPLAGSPSAAPLGSPAAPSSGVGGIARRMIGGGSFGRMGRGQLPLMGGRMRPVRPRPPRGATLAPSIAY